MEVVLVEPEIPPNTGNIARLCAATRLRLHLVEPLGFEISDRRVRRAGLDYWKYLDLVRHPSLEKFLEGRSRDGLFFFSKKAGPSYTTAGLAQADCLIFGCETRGLPSRVFEQFPDRIYRIPIFHPAVRSLNLSNAVALVVYEALRQQGRLE